MVMPTETLARLPADPEAVVYAEEFDETAVSVMIDAADPAEHLVDRVVAAEVPAVSHRVVSAVNQETVETADQAIDVSAEADPRIVLFYILVPDLQVVAMVALQSCDVLRL